MNATEAAARFRADAPQLAKLGIYLPGVTPYIPEIANDALPPLVTGANAGVPAFLTTMIDPEVIEVVLAPNNASKVVSEVRKGSWLDETAMFPMVERAGEVQSYGDYAENAMATANTQFPQRQSYLFQTMLRYGEREMERAALARINWPSQIAISAATVLGKFQNLTYFYGVSGLQCYGLLNDAALSAALTPAIKGAGGTLWVSSTGVMKATANEVYADIQQLFYALVNQTAGNCTRESPMTLALSPGSEVGLTATNQFGISVGDLLKKNFPNIKVVNAMQYAVSTSYNPQGQSSLNLAQLWLDSVDGQQTAYVAFNEKLRSHAVIQETSAWRQKQTSGTWGAIIRFPLGVAQMAGI